MPDKKIVIWSPIAQAEIRAIDRETATPILEAIEHYLTTGAGDYRVLFLRIAPLSIEVLRGRHRSRLIASPPVGIPVRRAQEGR
jgi:hypothetical protein